MPRTLDTLHSALSVFPRVTLLDGPTPIQKLSRLSAMPVLKGCNLYVKRDDLMGLGGGGNKLRKLEFLLGQALAQGADTLITWGGPQSNNARLTAAVAARHGLHCVLLLSPSQVRGDDDYHLNGNVLLNALFGATVQRLPAGTTPATHARELAEQLQRQGRKTFLMPLGGSSPVGCLGYAAGAAELLAQSQVLGVDFDQIVVPNGSSGTHAGLLAGLVAAAASTRVKGYSVLGTAEQSHEATLEKTRQVLELLNSDADLPRDAIHIDDSQRGAAYGAPTRAMQVATRTLATQEGLLIDPVYGGKALAGLLHSVAAGEYPPGSNILFVMTGGTPGIFAYRTAYS
ncbi:D-cysteine desulfhydrase family protein [Pseudomonas gingeri]|uniref:D-cysteine desulfhydrase family protein n=1 Tax=Pseudomonas gingeri TaxID=117681 RepID=UPI0015A37DE2|nr:D-cysteine desulfhydrase family protein [Pseudomonas gingeri]NWA01748.1 D-cysteine desulfhydrase family protein [Pseudomonas gingeri]NWA12847.1 D-cysteine desulfhydrase family protein [Pseudomonas gingeri]NWA57589.1 D-cysteine desulfhydrase family protein [Pseudomonas gingeri]NWA93218.1 D-cysteine desulfhydrase family protein [Pseudomonas gingeri]NWB03422.1 D-cysteine desulfhydrase family protein [Pseudomonas gingeri]